MQVGDVILEVDGHSLLRPGHAEVTSRLKGAGVFYLTIRRSHVTCDPQSEEHAGPSAEHAGPVADPAVLPAGRGPTGGPAGGQGRGLQAAYRSSTRVLTISKAAGERVGIKLEVDSPSVQGAGYGQQQRLFVDEMEIWSPAAKLLRVGDELVEVGGKPVHSLGVQRVIGILAGEER